MIPSPTFRTGLIGAGIGASKSPWMHETEAASLGLAFTYALFDLDAEAEGAAALPRLLDTAAAAGFAGVNITHPVKQAVIPLLDSLSDEATVLGAVNTVVLREGRTEGHNTDWLGFATGLKRQLPGARLERVVQMGAGGAGSAVAYALLSLGAELVQVFDLDEGRTADLIRRLEPAFPGRIVAGGDLGTCLAAAEGLVNATPVGMARYPGLPVPGEALRPDLWVAEVVYTPLETELLRAARALGCATADGGAMAVLQAAEAFRLFTQVAPDAERMLRRFRAAITR